MMRIGTLAIMLASAAAPAQAVVIAEGYSSYFDGNSTIIETFDTSLNFRLEIIGSTRKIHAAGAEATLEGDKWQCDGGGNCFVDNNATDGTSCGVSTANPMCRFIEYKPQGLGTQLYSKRQLMRLDGSLLRSSFALDIPAPVPENEDIIDLFPVLTSFFALVEGPDPVFYRITTSGGAVPEPASWAMLITGFGLTGAALRRRRMAPTPSETHS